MIKAFKLFNAFMLGVVLVALTALFINKAFGDTPRDEPPAFSMGVMQCGEVVAIWVVTKDGKVFRTDAGHHPDTAAEYNAFLAWLATGKQDVYEIPCPKTSK